MTTKHLLCCDAPSCGKQVEYNPYLRLEEVLPKEWLRIVPGEHGVEPLIFCSWDCLYQFGYNEHQAMLEITK